MMKYKVMLWVFAFSAVCLGMEAQDIVIRKRECCVCHQIKPVNEFSRNSQKCKECVKKADEEKKHQQEEEKRKLQAAREQEERERKAREQEERESPLKANAIGNDYYSGRNGKPQDYAEAVKWYRKSAEQGYATAQCNLGYMYDKGQGVTKSVSQARSWYEKAAAQGNESAKNNLNRLNGQ